jgi:plastocyanin
MHSKIRGKKKKMKLIWIIVLTNCLLFIHHQVSAEVGRDKPARVTGKILYEGEKIPKQGLLKTNEDIDYCGETIPSEHLLVDPGSKGIKNAVIALTPKNPIKNSNYSSGTKINALVNFHCRFAPHLIILKKGETLYLKNGDPVLHSNHFYKDKKTLFNLAMIPDSPPIKKVINEEGVIRVKCDIHDFMEGFIVVDPAPWVLLTGEDGSFDLGSVPAGNYQFSVWHETFDKLVSDLTFKSGEDRYLPLGVKPN